MNLSNTAPNGEGVSEKPNVITTLASLINTNMT